MENSKPKSRVYDVHLTEVLGDKTDVARGIAGRFGIELELAESLVRDIPLVVKRGVKLETAREFEAHLRNLGARALIKPAKDRDAPELNKPVESTGPKSISLAPTDPKAAGFVPMGSAPKAESSGRKKINFQISTGWVFVIVGALGLVTAFVMFHTPTRAGLSVHERGSGGRGDPALILLHGYGAGGDDLLPLADKLEDLGLEGVQIIMPEGLVQVGFGRAWWTGSGFVVARDKVSALVDDLIEDGTPAGNIIIGGFSQGGMLAYEVAMSYSPALGGAAIMSGGQARSPDSKAPETIGEEQRSVDFFFSHGSRDRSVSFQDAQRVSEQLAEAGCRVEWVPFNGRHEVPEQAQVALFRFVQSVFDGVE